jgi:hypothetical protein
MYGGTSIWLLFSVYLSCLCVPGADVPSSYVPSSLSDRMHSSQGEAVLDSLQVDRVTPPPVQTSRSSALPPEAAPQRAPAIKIPWTRQGERGPLLSLRSQRRPSEAARDSKSQDAAAIPAENDADNSDPMVSAGVKQQSLSFRTVHIASTRPDLGRSCISLSSNATCHRAGCTSRDVTYETCGKTHEGMAWRNFACTACAQGDPLFKPLLGKCIIRPNRATCALSTYTRTAATPDTTPHSIHTGTNVPAHLNRSLSAASPTATHCTKHRPTGAQRLHKLRRAAQQTSWLAELRTKKEHKQKKPPRRVPRGARGTQFTSFIVQEYKY